MVEATGLTPKQRGSRLPPLLFYRFPVEICVEGSGSGMIVRKLPKVQYIGSGLLQHD